MIMETLCREEYLVQLSETGVVFSMMALKSINHHHLLQESLKLILVSSDKFNNNTLKDHSST